MYTLRLFCLSVLAVAIIVNLIAWSQIRSRTVCFLCRGQMPGGTDGHGLGECVGTCADCTGAGCRDCLWLGAAGWEIAPSVDRGRPIRTINGLSRGRLWWLFLNAPMWRLMP